jgi:hypothetical protein
MPLIFAFRFAFTNIADGFSSLFGMFFESFGIIAKVTIRALIINIATNTCFAIIRFVYSRVPYGHTYWYAAPEIINSIRPIQRSLVIALVTGIKCGALSGFLSDFIEELIPKKSYISIPTRPPAEKWATPAAEFDINMAYQIFKERGINAEFLTGYEGNAFAFTGNVEEDLLSITSVHPMRKEGVNNFLSKAKADWSIIEKMIKEDKLVEVGYKDNKFYMRKLPGQL